MKSFLILALVAAAALALNGCATTGTNTASGDPVPGEKISDEGRFQPGTGGVTSPSASMKW